MRNVNKTALKYNKSVFYFSKKVIFIEYIYNVLKIVSLIRLFSTVQDVSIV